MPHIGGSDIAGTVDELGAGVHPSWLGKRVVADPSLDYDWYRLARLPHGRAAPLRIIGEHTQGGFAEHAVAPAANLIEIPEHTSAEVAAAAALVGVTAWHGLMARGGLRAGERVLVTGASGGVSTMAVQYAKAAGAEVFAVTSSAERVQRVRELGADHVYDRTTTPWPKEIYKATGKRGVDLCLDSVGEAIWPDLVRALAVGGPSGFVRRDDRGDRRRRHPPSLLAPAHGHGLDDGHAGRVPRGHAAGLRRHRDPTDPRCPAARSGPHGPRAPRGRRRLRQDRPQARDGLVVRIRDAQERVDRWISRFEEGYWPPLAILARLMEEVGELSREVNHRFGSKPKRDDEAPVELELEIADVLFVIISLANQQGIDLERAFARAMRKYEDRDAGRWTPKAAAPSAPHPTSGAT